MELKSSLSEDVKKLLNKEKYSFDDVVSIMRILRGENGCPWDRAQTSESIRANAIEEAYELVDAIDNKDINEQKEEIGDLLLQCVFHTIMAEENGDFDFDGVLGGLCEKLISRHTHIFGEDKANDATEALNTWEKNKIKKYNVGTTTEYMKKIPKSMPALTYAEKAQKRAAKVGFDWDEIDSVYDKINEEIGEVKSAATSEEIEDELGDLLFAVVNLCRFTKTDPEIALNKANNKFVRRFEFVENSLLSQGKKCEESTLTEMDKLWEQAKEKGL